MFRKNSRLRTAPSNPRKMVGVSALLVIGLTGVGVGFATSANAVEAPWTPQSSATLFPQYENEEQCYDGGQDVLVAANVDQKEGERIDGFTVDGNVLPGDAEYRVGVGVHPYTYVVTNLNSTSDPLESVTLSGSFEVVACADPEPPASPTVGEPTATGQLVDDKPVATVTVPVTVPEGSSGEVGVSFGEGQLLESNQKVTESGTIIFTGEVPCGTTEFTISLDGTPVKSTSVTIACVTPNPGDGGTGTPLPGSGGVDTPSTPDTGTDSQPTTPVVPEAPAPESGTDEGTKTVSDANTHPGPGTGDVVAASASLAMPLAPAGFLGLGGLALVAAAIWLFATPKARVRADH